MPVCPPEVAFEKQRVWKLAGCGAAGRAHTPSSYRVYGSYSTIMADLKKKLLRAVGSESRRWRDILEAAAALEAQHARTGSVSGKWVLAFSRQSGHTRNHWLGQTSRQAKQKWRSS